jgi:hypothetical protein
MSATEETPDLADPYQTFGYFDPFQAKRILKRFEAAGIRFQLADKSGVEQWDDIFPQRWAAAIKRRIEIDKIDSRVGKLFPIGKPFEIIAEVEAVH